MIALFTEHRARLLRSAMRSKCSIAARTTGRFIEEVCGDELDAAKLRIEERELEAGELN